MGRSGVLKNRSREWAGKFKTAVVVFLGRLH